MSDELKKAKIDELVKEHNLPAEIVSRCVADDGLVDIERLGIALQSAAFGKSGRGVVDQGHLASLKAAYAEAKGRKDASAMVSLTGRIFALEHGKG